MSTFGYDPSKPRFPGMPNPVVPPPNLTGLNPPVASGGSTTPGWYTPPQMPTDAGKRKGEQQKEAYTLQDWIFQNLQHALSFGNQIQPQQQALYQQLFNMLTPQGQQQLGQQFTQQQQGAAVDAGQGLAGQLRSLGLSTGAQAGALRSAQNSATKSSNQFKMSLDSPQGQMQAGQQALGLFNSAINPDISNFANLASIIYGKPNAVQHQNPWGSILGSVAGAAMGNPGSLAGLFGGGGGGYSGPVGVPGSLGGMSGGGGFGNFTLG
jgi:hypothetical protein